MIYIAHRALFEGYNERWENHPDQIRAALAAGFDAEIDVRMIDGSWWLGHDEPTYEVQPDFFEQQGLWIHCKNHDALANINNLDTVTLMFGYNPNYFWHQNDDFTLTSHGYIWTYPNKKIDLKRGIINQPEWNKGWFEDIPNMQGAGVCSKFVGAIKDVYNAG